MKIKCVSKEYENLTFGKEYDAIDSTGMFYVVIDDNGKTRMFRNKVFKEVKH